MGGESVDGNSTTSNLTETGGCVHQSTNQQFDQISWVIAITLAIMAAVSNNLGVNFQKLAWTKKQNNSKQTTYRIIWLLGMAGIVLASVFDFVALAFGPQSVIAPLGSLTMVMNGCVAPIMHGEKLRKKIIWTTIVIVSGCAMAVATASHDNVICNLDGIFGYFASYTFLGYALVIFFITVTVALLIRRAEAILNKYGEDSPQYDRIFKYHRVSYAFLAGLFGAQSVVFARAIGQLVMSSTRGEPIFFARYETWLILVGLIASIVVQMIYLNKGLARFESSYNVPVFTGTFIVGTAVSGGVVYGEFKNFSQLQAILFPLGVCLCVLGVFALAWSSDEETAEVEADDEAPAELPTVPVPPAGHTSSAAAIPALSVIVPHSGETITPRSSLKLHSGGFTPFIIGIGGPEEPPLIRKSIRRASSPAHPVHHHHGRDLLTGLRADDISPKAISGEFRRAGGGSGVFFAQGRGSGEFFTGTRNNAAPHDSDYRSKSKPNTPRNSALDDSSRKTKTPRSSAMDFQEQDLRRPITPTNTPSNSAEKSDASRQTPRGSGLAQLRRPLSPKDQVKPPEGF